MHIAQSLIVLNLLLCTNSVFSQPGFTVSGNIKDGKTGEDLIGATISVTELPGKGARTNTYGFYSITLPAGHYILKVQFIGYAPQSREVNLNNHLKINFDLEEIVSEMSEVIVTSRRKNENVTQTQTGMQKIEIKDLKTIPVLFGEKDVLKTIQLLPGIKSVGEGSSGFNVRGGASDQNLIMLDEATVYNASHLMGFFSVFNSDAIKDVSVYKGNEPAEYGGRLSSVLDIKMKDGNAKEFVINGGVGLISSHLNVEGPIVKDKGSFIISGRRTYVDLFLKLSSDTNIKSTKIHFFDINGKANYKINERNRIFLSGYYGQDMIGMSSFGINWGNSTSTLRWNHLFSDRLFSNTALIFSNYDYKININLGDEMNIISRIQDYVIKQDFQLYPGKLKAVKFGFLSTYHKIIPGAITATGNTDLKSLTNKYALENAVYFSHQLSFSDKLNAEYGVRISSFSLLGPGSFYRYNPEGYVIDTLKYESGKFVKTYLQPEPRFTMNYIIDEDRSLKAAYARNVQYLHLLSNSTSGSPTDLWIPSSNNVKPELSDQVSLGFYRNLSDNLYELSVEGYFKMMKNQIDYIDGAEITLNENVESQIVSGRGRAYGLELYAKKTQGRLNGWISYTLSRTERKFDEINGGHYYPAKQDKTHNVSIVAMYEINKKWTLSGNWVFSTGNAVTFPSGKYEIDGKTMMLYTDRNASRMPSYHRLDIGATWLRKKTEKFESSWTFSIYNYYGRENAYTITFRDKESSSEKTEAVLTSLFRFIPSFTYNFKF